MLFQCLIVSIISPNYVIKHSRTSASLNQPKSRGVDLPREGQANDIMYLSNENLTYPKEKIMHKEFSLALTSLIHA